MKHTDRIPIKFFLSTKFLAIFEVYTVSGRSNLCCTCPGFRLMNTCKHQRYVLAQAEIYDGIEMGFRKSPKRWESLRMIRDANFQRKWMIENRTDDFEEVLPSETAI